jgi:hypothetical protein
MTSSRLIGLYSPAPQSGKTTVASTLTEHGYYTIPFAAPLKRITRTFLVQLGYGPDVIEDLLTTDKETKIPSINCSTRHLLQTLGTEWGRSCVHPDVWLMCWRATAERYLGSNTPVVVDDVRFPNEADLIRTLGGELWHIERPGTERGTLHASEGSLDDYSFDRYLLNDSGVGDLVAKAETLLRQPVLAA